MKIFVRVLFFLWFTPGFFPGVAFAQSWQEQAQALFQDLAQADSLQRKTGLSPYCQRLAHTWRQVAFSAPEPPPAAGPPLPQAAPDASGMSYQLHPKAVVSMDVSHYSPQSATPAAHRLPELSGHDALNRTANYSFYGAPLSLRYDARMQFSLATPLTASQVQMGWRTLERSAHEAIRYQLTRTAAQLNLNDWGYLQLLHQAAQQLYPRDANAQTLFAFFCLSQSGYRTRLSSDQRRLYLLVPSQQRIYGASFLRLEGQKYYALGLDGTHPDLDRAHLLDMAYPAARKVLDFRISHPLNLGKSLVKRTFEFSYHGRTFRLPVVINRRVVAFYKSYPVLDLQIPLTAPMSPESAQSFIPRLRTLLKGQSKATSVNFLLSFVQHAFPYKRDGEQFGRENYLFLDETLYYPYSDCEDRSVLFAWLVKHVLDLEVVALVFPGHAATGVHFTQPVQGSYLRHKGKKYIICDPSYMGATYGMCLPSVQHTQAKVVEF